MQFALCNFTFANLNFLAFKRPFFYRIRSVHKLPPRFWASARIQPPTNPPPPPGWGWSVHISYPPIPIPGNYIQAQIMW